MERYVSGFMAGYGLCASCTLRALPKRVFALDVSRVYAVWRKDHALFSIIWSAISGQTKWFVSQSRSPPLPIALYGLRSFDATDDGALISGRPECEHRTSSRAPDDNARSG